MCCIAIKWTAQMKNNLNVFRFQISKFYYCHAELNSFGWNSTEDDMVKTGFDMIGIQLGINLVG